MAVDFTYCRPPCRVFSEYFTNEISQLITGLYHSGQSILTGRYAFKEAENIVPIKGVSARNDVKQRDPRGPDVDLGARKAFRPIRNLGRLKGGGALGNLTVVILLETINELLRVVK